MNVCPTCGEGWAEHVCRWPNRMADLATTENATLAGMEPFEDGGGMHGADRLEVVAPVARVVMLLEISPTGLPAVKTWELEADAAFAPGPGWTEQEAPPMPMLGGLPIQLIPGQP